MKSLVATSAALGVSLMLVGEFAVPDTTRTSPPTVADHAIESRAAVDPNGIVEASCVRCHSDARLRGNLSLESFDIDQASDNAEVIERMIRKVRAGMMPPPGVRAPGGDTLQIFAAELEKVSPMLTDNDRKYFQGRVHELERETEAAIACYDDVLALDENHKQALFRLALNVDLRGEDEEARELYERALMAPPVNVACVVNLGILYEDIGNYRRAMQCFDLVLQADPENDRARLYRRDAAAALNMYYDEDQERRDDKRNKLLRTPINDFELSVRSRNCLAKMNIRTLGDLVKKTEAELLSYKNFGETSLLSLIHI